MRRDALLAAALMGAASTLIAADIDWNAARGSVRSVRFSEAEAPRFGGSAVDAARAFMADRAPLFNGVAALAATRTPGPLTLGLGLGGAEKRGTPEVEVSRVDEGDKVTFVRMRQLHQGLPVEGGDVVVAVRQGGAISAVQGGYAAQAHDPAALAAIASANIGGDEALAVAKDAVKADTLGEHQTASRVFWVDGDGALVAAYRVELLAVEPRADWLVYVDAATGRVLEKRDEILNLDEGAKTGKAKVYMSNPLKGGLEEVTLTGLDGSGKLSGPATEVKNGKGPTIVAADGNFVVDENSPHFGEVMQYFHVNRIHDALKTIEAGWTGMDHKVPVTAHDKGSFFMKNDNAFYSPMDKELHILDPKKLNDLHLEAEVVYHEYHHAVTDAIVPGLSSVEGRAMHEGYSDYFACSLSEDPEIGEWAVKPIGKPNMRDLRSGRHYPEDLSPQREPHSDGEIWAAGCWSLRTKLGAQKADFLVHKSRFYISGSATFHTAYEGILAADKDFLGSANQDAIKEVFDARGISGPTAGGSEAGDGAVAAGSKVRFGEIFASLD